MMICKFKFTLSNGYLTAGGSKPESKPVLEGRNVKLKTLGNGAYRPISQSMGTYCHDDAGQDLDVFSKLARDYVFEGQDRGTICSINANVSVSICLP